MDFLKVLIDLHLGDEDEFLNILNDALYATDKPFSKDSKFIYTGVSFVNHKETEFDIFINLSDGNIIYQKKIGEKEGAKIIPKLTGLYCRSEGGRYVNFFQSLILLGFNDKGNLESGNIEGFVDLVGKRNHKEVVCSILVNGSFVEITHHGFKFFSYADSGELIENRLPLGNKNKRKVFQDYNFFRSYESPRYRNDERDYDEEIYESRNEYNSSGSSSNPWEDVFGPGEEAETAYWNTQ